MDKVSFTVGTIGEKVSYEITHDDDPVLYDAIQRHHKMRSSRRYVVHMVFDLKCHVENLYRGGTINATIYASGSLIPQLNEAITIVTHRDNPWLPGVVLSPNTYKFYYDGRRLIDNDTMISLGMEAGDFIDTFKA
jgi:hypothetical protein